jgi:hypothetical protein
MGWGYIIKKLPFFIALLMSMTLSTFLFAENETQVNVTFHNFPWGTSLQEFKARMGEPVHTEVNNGLQSLIYENVRVSGFRAFMIAYFSQNGLEGGTYYFDTTSVEELMRCYTELQIELSAIYGPTLLFESLMREMRPYETSWNLPSGYIYLKVNTRWLNEPVTLWYSSPELTKKIREN